jgi:hypothetical protein
LRDGDRRQDKSWDAPHRIDDGGGQPTASPAVAGFSILFADSVFDAEVRRPGEAVNFPLPVRRLFGLSHEQVSMD